MKRWWARWRLRRTCSAWDPLEGAGRDTHVCLLVRGHRVAHRCKCGAVWSPGEADR